MSRDLDLKRRRFTIDEYHRMADFGILTEDDRVELLDGEIIEMAPIGLRHASICDRLTRLFTSRLGDRVIVRVGGPIILPSRIRNRNPTSRCCVLDPTSTRALIPSRPTSY